MVLRERINIIFEKNTAKTPAAASVDTRPSYSYYIICDIILYYILFYRLGLWRHAFSASVLLLVNIIFIYTRATDAPPHNNNII